MNEIRANRLEATLEGITLHNGLTIDSVQISGQDIRLDPETKGFESEPLDILVRISAGSIANFLEIKAPSNLRNFEVGCEEDKLFVKVSVRVLLEVRGVCVVALDIVDSTKLSVRLVDAQFLGVNPKTLIEGQLASMNPIFDLSELPIEGEISSVECRDSEVVVRLRGRLRLVS